MRTSAAARRRSVHAPSRTLRAGGRRRRLDGSGPPLIPRLNPTDGSRPGTVHQPRCTGPRDSPSEEAPSLSRAKRTDRTKAQRRYTPNSSPRRGCRRREEQMPPGGDSPRAPRRPDHLAPHLRPSVREAPVPRLVPGSAPGGRPSDPAQNAHPFQLPACGARRGDGRVRPCRRSDLTSTSTSRSPHPQRQVSSAASANMSSCVPVSLFVAPPPRPTASFVGSTHRARHSSHLVYGLVSSELLHVIL